MILVVNHRDTEPIYLYTREDLTNAGATVGFAGPQYFNPWWKQQARPGATAYIDAHFQFEAGGGGDFLCDILQDAIEAFAVVQPEFLVGDIELGEAIRVACDCANGGDNCLI